MEQMERYLRATPTIDCDNESIKEKALDLTKGQVDTADKAKSIFYFMRDEIIYNAFLVSDRLEHFRASSTLDRGEGFCSQKAALFAALSRAAGIPARLRFAAIRNHLAPSRVWELLGSDLLVAHGYDELYIEGKWVKAAATFDLKMCQKHRLIPVEFDGKNDALLPSHNPDGQPHIEYVQDHGHYDDIPLDKIMELRIEAYGADFLERLKQSPEKRKAER